jgi:DNA-binding NarL/FixJ family response regulator
MTVKLNRPGAFNAGESAVLSPRQREIATLAARSLRNKEIARKLGLAESTVKFQMHNILGKLGVKRRSELVLCGFPHGPRDHRESAKSASVNNGAE